MTAMATFELVAGDLEPALDIDLTVDGAAEDVSDATDVITMHWRRPDGTTANVVLTSVDLARGEVQYQWQPGDTLVPGIHRAQVTVPRPQGPQTFPSDGTYIRWVVHPLVTG